MRNVSFRICLRWPLHIINPVDTTKLSCYTSHRRSTHSRNLPPLAHQPLVQFLSSKVSNVNKTLSNFQFMNQIFNSLEEHFKTLYSAAIPCLLERLKRVLKDVLCCMLGNCCRETYIDKALYFFLKFFELFEFLRGNTSAVTVFIIQMNSLCKFA